MRRLEDAHEAIQAVAKAYIIPSSERHPKDGDGLACDHYIPQTTLVEASKTRVVGRKAICAGSHPLPNTVER